MVIRALTASEALDLRGKDLQGADIFGLISKSVAEPVLSVEDVGLIPSSMITELMKEIFTFNGLGSKAISDAVDELKKTDVSTTNSAAS